MMKLWIIAVALVVLFSGTSHAAFYCSDPNRSCYFRPIDFGHIQQSGGFLIDPHDPGATTTGITSIALFTHDTKDGSVIPQGLRGILAPEDWALGVGGGGSFQKDIVVVLDATANIAPQIGNTAFKAVGSGSPGWLQTTKAMFLGTSQYGKIRLGWAAAGNLVKGGVFQSAKEAVPGQGFLDIMNQISRAEVGYAWTYGQSAAPQTATAARDLHGRLSLL